MEHSIEEHEVLLPPSADIPITTTPPKVESIVETIEDVIETIIADSVQEAIAPLKENVEETAAKVAAAAATIFDSETLIHQIPVDSVVKSVLSKFVSRAEFGMKKYGTNLDRKDLNVLDWIQHAQEEHMDAILYLEKLKKEVNDTSVVAQKLLSQIPGATPQEDPVAGKTLFGLFSRFLCSLMKK